MKSVSRICELTTGRDDLSATFNTNVNGVQIVTASLLPLLQKGKQRKVINV